MTIVFPRFSLRVFVVAALASSASIAEDGGNWVNHVMSGSRRLEAGSAESVACVAGARCDCSFSVFRTQEERCRIRKSISVAPRRGTSRIEDYAEEVDAGQRMSLCGVDATCGFGWKWVPRRELPVLNSACDSGFTVEAPDGGTGVRFILFSDGGLSLCVQ